MNQVFDFTRFRLLVARHWMENRQRYLLSLGAIAGLLILWFVFFFMMNNGTTVIRQEFQFGTYMFSLFVAGSLFASSLFAPLSSKGRGINYLSIPASHLEKLLVALLYGFVIFFICFTLVFYVVDWLVLQITNPIVAGNWKEHYPNDVFTPEPVANVFTVMDKSFDGTSVFVYILMIYFSVQSIFLAGSVFFKKFSFIKTVLAGLVIGFAYWLVMYIILISMLPEGGFRDELSGFWMRTDSGMAMVKVPHWMITACKLFFVYCIPPFLWLAAWQRLKEKEI